LLAFLPYLARIEEGGGINYSKFITQFQIATANNDVGNSLRQFQNEILAAVGERLSSQFSNLQEAFKELDSDGILACVPTFYFLANMNFCYLGSGALSYDELVQALQKLNIGLTPEQMQDLMTSMVPPSVTLSRYFAISVAHDSHLRTPILMAALTSTNLRTALSMPSCAPNSPTPSESKVGPCFHS